MGVVRGHDLLGVPRRLCVSGVARPSVGHPVAAPRSAAAAHGADFLALPRPMTRASRPGRPEPSASEESAQAMAALEAERDAARLAAATAEGEAKALRDVLGRA